MRGNRFAAHPLKPNAISVFTSPLFLTDQGRNLLIYIIHGYMLPFSVDFGEIDGVQHMRGVFKRIGCGVDLACFYNNISNEIISVIDEKLDILMRFFRPEYTGDGIIIYSFLLNNSWYGGLPTIASNFNISVSPSVRVSVSLIVSKGLFCVNNDFNLL